MDGRPFMALELAGHEHGVLHEVFKVMKKVEPMRIKLKAPLVPYLIAGERTRPRNEGRSGNRHLLRPFDEHNGAVLLQFGDGRRLLGCVGCCLKSRKEVAFGKLCGTKDRRNGILSKADMRDEGVFHAKKRFLTVKTKG